MYTKVRNPHCKWTQTQIIIIVYASNILISSEFDNDQFKCGIVVYELRYTAISIKVVHEQSGKVEYERERLLAIVNKLMNFQSNSQQPFALVFDFSLCLWTTLKCIYHGFGVCISRKFRVF
jgi:hypothetical protein